LRGNAGSTICFLASPEDAELLVEYSGEYIAQTYSNLSNGNLVAIHALDISALGLLGTPISDAHITMMLEKLEIENVVIMLDGDAPGRKLQP